MLVLASPNWTVMRNLAGTQVRNAAARLYVRQPASGAEPGNSCNIEPQPSPVLPEGSVQ